MSKAEHEGLQQIKRELARANSAKEYWQRRTGDAEKAIGRILQDPDRGWEIWDEYEAAQ